MATEKDLTVERGVEFNFCQSIKNPDTGAPIPGLTSGEISAQIRLFPGAPVVAEFTPSEEADAPGHYQFTLAYADTLKLKSSLVYDYDVHFRFDSSVERASFGKIRPVARVSNLAPA